MYIFFSCKNYKFSSTFLYFKINLFFKFVWNQTEFTVFIIFSLLSKNIGCDVVSVTDFFLILYVWFSFLWTAFLSDINELLIYNLSFWNIIKFFLTNYFITKYQNAIVGLSGCVEDLAVGPIWKIDKRELEWMIIMRFRGWTYWQSRIGSLL
jgi:hypothetical protein